MICSSDSGRRGRCWRCSGASRTRTDLCRRCRGCRSRPARPSSPHRRSLRFRSHRRGHRSWTRRSPNRRCRGCPVGSVEHGRQRSFCGRKDAIGHRDHHAIRSPVIADQRTVVGSVDHPIALGAVVGDRPGITVQHAVDDAGVTVERVRVVASVTTWSPLRSAPLAMMVGEKPPVYAAAATVPPGPVAQSATQRSQGPTRGPVWCVAPSGEIPAVGDEPKDPWSSASNSGCQATTNRSRPMAWIARRCSPSFRQPAATRGAAGPGRLARDCSLPGRPTPLQARTPASLGRGRADRRHLTPRHRQWQRHTGTASLHHGAATPVRIPPGAPGVPDSELWLDDHQERNDHQENQHHRAATLCPRGQGGQLGRRATGRWRRRGQLDDPLDDPSLDEERVQVH